MSPPSEALNIATAPSHRAATFSVLFKWGMVRARRFLYAIMLLGRVRASGRNNTMVSDSEARSIGEQAPSGFAMPVDEYEIGGASDHPESSEVEIPCAFAGA